MNVIFSGFTVHYIIANNVHLLYDIIFNSLSLFINYCQLHMVVYLLFFFPILKKWLNLRLKLNHGIITLNTYVQPEKHMRCLTILFTMIIAVMSLILMAFW